MEDSVQFEVRSKTAPRTRRIGRCDLRRHLILAQAAIDSNDVANAKRYLLAAGAASRAKSIEQSGLDVSVARALYDRGEHDAVLEYLHRGYNLCPQGAQIINRWEAAIRAGRRPNFNNRGNNAQQVQQQVDGR